MSPDLLAANSSTANMTNATDAGEDEGSTPLETAMSIVVMSGAGALLALSMTIQRHSLSSPVVDGKVPLLRCRVKRLYAWFFGLVVYGAASGFKVLAFNLGPFTILSSVFVGVLLIT